MARDLTALVVDDEEIMQKIISAHLSSLGVNVVGKADNGREGIDLALTLEPDIIFLDILMPKMNGFLALQEIVGRYPNAFVIMMTSVEDEEVKRQTRLEGAQDYLLKSLPAADLVAKLKIHVDFLKARKKP